MEVFGLPGTQAFIKNAEAYLSIPESDYVAHSLPGHQSLRWSKRMMAMCQGRRGCIKMSR